MIDVPMRLLKKSKSRQTYPWGVEWGEGNSLLSLFYVEVDELTTKKLEFQKLLHHYHPMKYKSHQQVSISCICFTFI